MNRLDPRYQRLGVNIDHVATIRNARGGALPDPARAAKLAQEAGADGLTIHLREDRRHIRDADLPLIAGASSLPINLELAATEEMVAIACDYRPHAACIVPERREEVTTEGGLDVIGLGNQLPKTVKRLAAAGCRVSLFVNTDQDHLKASADAGAAVVELHTGPYCHAFDSDPKSAETARELAKLAEGAAFAHALGLEVHAGHGLTFDSVVPISAIPEVKELNIGHFLIGESVFLGLTNVIAKMQKTMQRQRETLPEDFAL